MTKKHFIALADVLIALREDAMEDKSTPQIRTGRLDQWGRIRNALGDFCAAQNPRFNRDRWLGYIAGTNGRNGGKVKV
jgi:hypothetical protein